MVRTACNRASCQPVLAIMGKLAANHLADRARHEVPGLFNSPARLRQNAGVEFLSTADHSDHRDILSPGSSAAERQRSILEALIANVAPLDAAAISSALLEEFISLGRVFSQTTEAIERVLGPNSDIASLLHSAHRACVESLGMEIRLRSVTSTDQTLIDYLVASMGSQPVERLRVLFLDRTNRLIGDEIMASGTLATLTVYPRNIFKRSLELSASAILLVHNHPGGNVEPSQCDIEFTRSIAASARLLEITSTNRVCRPCTQTDSDQNSDHHCDILSPD
jgi:DNA repair protein RadC